jgi:hypothetical protein
MWPCACVCSQLLTKAYVSEVILHLKGYRFYGVHEEDFSLFILYVQTTGWNARTASMTPLAADVGRLFLRHACCCCCVFLHSSYSESVSVHALSSYNKEILENVLRHNGALIAE